MALNWHLLRLLMRIVMELPFKILNTRWGSAASLLPSPQVELTPQTHSTAYTHITAPAAGCHHKGRPLIPHALSDNTIKSHVAAPGIQRVQHTQPVSSSHCNYMPRDRVMLVDSTRPALLQAQPGHVGQPAAVLLILDNKKQLPTSLQLPCQTQKTRCSRSSDTNLPARECSITRVAQQRPACTNSGCL